MVPGLWVYLIDDVINLDNNGKNKVDSFYWLEVEMSFWNYKSRSGNESLKL